MKSYLRFLGRNKLYTAIEVIGLSVALAFVLILSSYIIDEIRTDREVKDKGMVLYKAGLPEEGISPNKEINTEIC